jgi:6-pyruvoyl-tetrahydropterin synthase
MHLEDVEQAIGEVRDALDHRFLNEVEGLAVLIGRDLGRELINTSRWLARVHYGTVSGLKMRWAALPGRAICRSRISYRSS